MTQRGGLGRRAVLGAASAAALARHARAAARWRRYNVTSTEGQKQLAIMAKGIQAMLDLPTSDPRNWFRHAFIHLLDCPHGNWWFYTWHRGYIGLLERTIRTLTCEDGFTLPYWDWSALPRVPAPMFDGVLSPSSNPYLRYTRDLLTFDGIMKPPMLAYWNSLSAAQKQEQNLRGVPSFDTLWAGSVVGEKPEDGAFATTAAARYVTAAMPGLDAATAYDASAGVVMEGLASTIFSTLPQSTIVAYGFNSIRATSHVVQPGGNNVFSVLESLPHNNVHNFIGGDPAWKNRRYGLMTNFLSAADPLFYLHHANMDRLWDVWTRKQMALGLPYQPYPADMAIFMDEPFRYFFDDHGNPLDAKAGDFFDIATFGYDYQPGTGEAIVPTTPVPAPALSAASAPASRLLATGRMAGSIATLDLAVPAGAHLVAAITLQASPHGSRMFDVFVNAPAGAAPPSVASPSFAGRIAFFGPPGHHGGGSATFLVPLTTPRPGGGTAPIAALAQPALAGQGTRISVVPVQPGSSAPVVSSISVSAS